MSFATEVADALGRVGQEFKQIRSETGKRPAVLRRLTYGAGGQGNTVSGAVSFSQRGLRIPVQLFCDTTRWRIRAWNNGYAEPLVSKSDMTAKGLIIGDADYDDLPDGLFKDGATLTTLISGDWVIPGSPPVGGDYYGSNVYVSPWFEDPAMQFTSGVTRNLGTGVTVSYGSHLTMEQQALHTATAADGIDPDETSWSNGWLPFSMVIEYETVTDKEVVVFFGDSIATGIMGAKGASQASHTPVPTFMNYPNRWAKKNGVLVQQVGFSGLAGANFTTANTFPDQLFGRTDLTTPEFDIIIFALGSNDAASSQTLAVYQLAVKTVLDYVRPLANPDAEAWIVNVPPRALGSTPEGRRVDYNDWSAQEPYGITGVVDMDGAFSNGTTGLKSSLSMDGIHWSFSGNNRGSTELEKIRKLVR